MTLFLITLDCNVRRVEGRGSGCKGRRGGFCMSVSEGNPVNTRNVITESCNHQFTNNKRGLEIHMCLNHMRLNLFTVLQSAEPVLQPGVPGCR